MTTDAIAQGERYLAQKQSLLLEQAKVSAAVEKTVLSLSVEDKAAIAALVVEKYTGVIANVQKDFQDLQDDYTAP